MGSFFMFQCVPRRFIIAIMGFLSFAILNTQRVNIAHALEAMTISSVNTTSSVNGSRCGQNFTTNATIVHLKRGTFDWDSKIQGYILSSSSVGFVLTQILGGRLAETFGAKQMMCFSLLCMSVCTIISPAVTHYSVYYLMAARFAKGLAQGLLQPSVSCLMARWYPEEERSFLTSVTYSGYPTGALIGGIVSGLLCDSNILGGWPSVFYVFGFAGIVHAAVALCLVYNSPEEYDGKVGFQLEITVTEKMSKKEEEKLQIPWTHMLLSTSTWALIAGMIAQYWMTIYFISVHTAYLSDVLYLDTTQTGMFSSLPYILQIIVTWFGSYISDWLTKKQFASVDTVRKYCNTITVHIVVSLYYTNYMIFREYIDKETGTDKFTGCLGFSSSMLVVVYAECSVNLNIICFFIAMTSIGLGFPGCLTIPMDMSKNFTGTLIGLCGTIASMTGFILPVIVGHIIQEEGNLVQWRTVILISIFLVMTCAAIFHAFGSAQLQPWDDAPIEELKNDQEQNSNLKKN